jgi:hypothetical protein
MTSCGGSGGGSRPGQGFRVLGNAIAGPSTVRLIAVRGAPRGRLQPASAFIAVTVGGTTVVEQTVGRLLGFNWSLLNRPGGGGVIALASVGRGPQYITVTVRKSATAYGTRSYTLASDVLLPAGGTLPASS